MWEQAEAPGTTIGLIIVEAAKCAGAPNCTVGRVSNEAVRLAVVGTRGDLAVWLGLARKGHCLQFQALQTPIEGQVLSGTMKKLFIMKEPSKTTKFRLCPADYFLVFQQCKGPWRVVGHKGKHKRSISIKPLVKGFEDWFTFPEYGDQGSQRA